MCVCLFQVVRIDFVSGLERTRLRRSRRRKWQENVLLLTHTRTCMHAEIRSKPQHIHTHTYSLTHSHTWERNGNGGVTSGDDGVKELCSALLPATSFTHMWPAYACVLWVKGGVRVPLLTRRVNASAFASWLRSYFIVQFAFLSIDNNGRTTKACRFNQLISEPIISSTTSTLILINRQDNLKLARILLSCALREKKLELQLPLLSSTRSPSLSVNCNVIVYLKLLLVDAAAAAAAAARCLPCGVIVWSMNGKIKQ